MPRATLQHKASNGRKTELVEGAVYMTPLGRLCQLLPPPTAGIGSDGLTIMFAYLRSDGTRLKDDGFSLYTGTAQRILQRVA
ncbi:MAG: hypothetical protein MUF08_19005 [Burkholderiaceae bacterium]|jgi:hypothetical protein|nr:hypothetical protein [Burkholderiaceae bacterium]